METVGCERARVKPRPKTCTKGQYLFRPITPIMTSEREAICIMDLGARRAESNSLQELSAITELRISTVAAPALWVRLRDTVLHSMAVEAHGIESWQIYIVKH